jgi:hypothetical protein
MGSLPRTAPRLIAATIILLGCAPGSGSAPAHGAAPTAIPSAWATGSFVVADTTAPTADTLYAIGAGPQNDGLPPVVVSLTVPPGADLREFLDGAGGHRADVLVTRDANVIAYAASRADYLSVALLWSSTYLLLPARTSARIILPTTAERNALARDVVTSGARGAAEPFPWLTDSACAVVATAPSAPSLPLMGYTAGDVTARQLAERIVALAGANPQAPWVSATLGHLPHGVDVHTAAMRDELLAEALASGRIMGAVVPIGRDPRTSCFTASNERVRAGAVPLVDTRAYVIVRRGSGAAFTVGADGSLHFLRRSAP